MLHRHHLIKIPNKRQSLFVLFCYILFYYPPTSEQAPPAPHTQKQTPRNERSNTAAIISYLSPSLSLSLTERGTRPATRATIYLFIYVSNITQPVRSKHSQERPYVPRRDRGGAAEDIWDGVLSDFVLRTAAAAGFVLWGIMIRVGR
jgi:hypothetical protein